MFHVVAILALKSGRKLTVIKDDGTFEAFREEKMNRRGTIGRFQDIFELTRELHAVIDYRESVEHS